MKLLIAIIFGVLLNLQLCVAQDSLPSGAMDALKSDVDAAEAKVNALTEAIRMSKANADTTTLPESEQSIDQLRQAIDEAFEAQVRLQLAQLADAEAKIASSRKRIEARNRRASEIVAKRLETLLRVPPDNASPQTVLDALERFTAAKDYEGLVGLMTDDEADRMAGMLMQAMSMMGNMLSLMEATNESNNEIEMVRAIFATSNDFMRPNPPPESIAALQQLTTILPSVFYQMGATSNGKPLEPPSLTADEYMRLLRRASGVLTDTRAYSASMMEAASSMEVKTEGDPIESQWKIEVDGIHAIATQIAQPLDRTTSKTARVKLEIEDGLWKIGQLGSDEEMMQAFGGASLTAASPASPTAIGTMKSSQAMPSDAAAHANDSRLPKGPSPVAAPYPSRDEEIERRNAVRQLIQGKWVVERVSDAGEDEQPDLKGVMEVVIEGDMLRMAVGDQGRGVVLLDWQQADPLVDHENQPYSVDFVLDPNGVSETHRGILECDKETLRFCYASDNQTNPRDFRPRLFVPGSKVVLFECRRQKANVTGTPESTLLRSETGLDDQPKLPEWNDFLELLPESGTALVMFSEGAKTKEQMMPVAKKVAEAASAQFIELPQRTWRQIIAPPATHFVLMKDRQLVATRSGLLTESRMQEFVGLAKDWLTPISTGVKENSLVRIDCYINPGRGNIGSQYGGAYLLTTAVVAVHEDEALLLGPESIGKYIEKGYACVAIVQDALGKQKQVPLDIVLTGPVKLMARDIKAKNSLASGIVTPGDGQTSEYALTLESMYPKSATQPLDAYDTGSAIYHIRGTHGLTAVSLSAVDYLPQVDQRVLSGSFTRDRSYPPIRDFRSPLHWQSQLVDRVDAAVYGGNINGPELIDVLCPKLPAPNGFTFTQDGKLIGKYALGNPTDEDMTHHVFQPYTAHSVIRAAREKINDKALIAAIDTTLHTSPTNPEETNTQ